MVLSLVAHFAGVGQQSAAQLLPDLLLQLSDPWDSFMSSLVMKGADFSCRATSSSMWMACNSQRLVHVSVHSHRYNQQRLIVPTPVEYFLPQMSASAFGWDADSLEGVQRGCPGSGGLQSVLARRGQALKARHPSGGG